jgi:hypothetical protein
MASMHEVRNGGPTRIAFSNTDVLDYDRSSREAGLGRRDGFRVNAT